MGNGFVNEHEVARRLNLPVGEIVEYIKDGHLTAVFKDDEWLVRTRDLEQFQARYGTDSKTVSRSVRHQAIAERHGGDTFSLSRTIVAFGGAIGLIAFLVGLGIVISAFFSGGLQRAMMGGVLILVSCGYIVFFEVQAAVLNMQSHLRQIAEDVDEIKHWRE